MKKTYQYNWWEENFRQVQGINNSPSYWHSVAKYFEKVDSAFYASGRFNKTFGCLDYQWVNNDHIFIEMYFAQLCYAKAEVSVPVPVYSLIETANCFNQIFAVSDVSSTVKPTFHVLEEFCGKSLLVILGNIYKLALYTNVAVLKRAETFFDPFLICRAIGIREKNVLSTWIIQSDVSTFRDAQILFVFETFYSPIFEFIDYIKSPISTSVIDDYYFKTLKRLI